MQQAGCTVNVYTTTANGPVELAVAANTTVCVDHVMVTYFKRITKDHTHFSPLLLWRLWREVRGFDVVHIHAWWNLVSVFSCFIAVIRKVPVVVSPRGTLSAYSFTNRSSFSKRTMQVMLGKYLLRRSFIHVTSQKEGHDIYALIHPKKLMNIPNFVVLGAPPGPLVKPKDSRLELLFLSRIEEKKGLDILFNALESVTIPYHLTIAGDGEPGYVANLKALAARQNIYGNISWIGFQGGNKFELLAGMDIMVLTSHDENFGNVVIESLSVGTAVLISKNVGLADYVSENNLGWVCELEADNIRSFIELIANATSARADIRSRAPGRIQTDYREDNLAKRYMDMYKQVINHG